MIRLKMLQCSTDVKGDVKRAKNDMITENDNSLYANNVKWQIK